VSVRGVFFGTSAFAVPALRAFATAVDCTLVVTQPARPAGRGKRLAETPVALAAAELGLPVYAPERLRGEAIERLAAEGADVFAVASYGKLVPQTVLDLPPLGALNVHPSPLPRYRGATPLQAQLRDGVRDGAVTIIAMDEGLDTGDVVVRAPLPIGERETYGELHDRAADLGAVLLSRACRALADGTATRTPQRQFGTDAEAEATMTRPLQKTDLLLTPGGSVRELVDFIRSLAPAPGARLALPAILGPGEMLKVSAGHALARADGPDVDPSRLLEPGSHGTAIAAGTILIAASDGWVAVDRLTPPGRREMSAREYGGGALSASAVEAGFVTIEELGGERLTGPKPFAAALRAWAAAVPA